jgi:hypothetical protein
MYVDGSGGCVGCLLGLKPDTLGFQPALYQHKALIERADSAELFKAWVEEILRDWDFDIIAAAHTANKVGGAKQALAAALQKAQKTFDDFSKKHPK